MASSITASSLQTLRALLQRPNLCSVDEDWIKQRYCGHPWAWPGAVASALAEQLTSRGISPPKPALVGETLLLAFLPQSRQGSLWWLRASGDESPRLEKDAVQAWRDALAAVPRSLHVMTGALKGLGQHSPSVNPLEQGARLLDGRSLGLSFCLAIASRVLDLPVPCDLAASAAITPDGALEEVNGLQEKLAKVGELAPSICRVLVAQEQLKEALRVAPAHIEVIGVRSVADGLNRAFDVSSHLTSQAKSRESREQLAAHLFEVALGGRSATVSWTPIAKAASFIATAARREGDTLQVINQVRFAEAVAARHDGLEDEHAHTMPMPSSGWFNEYPPGIRRHIVAHTIQQCADVGHPSLIETKTLAETWLQGRRGVDVESEDLRVMGAYGRLLLVCGSPCEALAWQREALAGWRAYRAWGEISHPLSAIYLLAGALGDDETFEEALAQETNLQERNAIGYMSSRYLSLSRSRARVLLNRDLDEATRDLGALGYDAQLARHLRYSALRWLAGSRDASQAQRAFQELHSHLDRDGRDVLHDRVFLTLSVLDTALTEGNHVRAEQILRDHPHESILKNMFKYAPTDTHPAEFIARFYPY